MFGGICEVWLWYVVVDCSNIFLRAQGGCLPDSEGILQDVGRPRVSFPPSCDLSTGMPTKRRRRLRHLREELRVQVFKLYKTFFVCFVTVSYTHLTLPTKLEV